MISLLEILNNILFEEDPKKGTGKKPKGSGRRLYTDEDPKDTVRIKFKTKEDIVDTLNKKQFKAKSHARQSQVINLIHQRVRAAYGKAKDPEVKSRLKRALDYIESRKESSKEKTERLRKMKEASDPQAGTALPYGSGFAPVNEVGEANLKPYKWKETDREGYSIYTKFETDSGTIYSIDLEVTKYKDIPVFNIEFSAKPKGAEGSSSKIVVNKGEMYKVMSTITDIVKKYLKKFPKVKGISYYPSKKGNEDFGTQRDNLYKAFISKAIPGAKFEPIDNVLYGDGTVALMPDAKIEEKVKDLQETNTPPEEQKIDTLSKKSFKSKPHARKSQIINVIHQRVRAAYNKAKDPDVKARLKRGLDYITKRKEASKKKTKSLSKDK